MLRSCAVSIVTLLTCGCANLGPLPGPIDGCSRSEWIAKVKRDDPRHFAFQYGWIDQAGGIDANEAAAIANLYFRSSGVLCGAIVSQKKIGRRWRFECGIGYGGDRVQPIWVDATTGAVWQSGGERIEDIWTLLRSE